MRSRMMNAWKVAMCCVGLFLIFCSCNHNDEPDLETSFPIKEVYVPVSIIVDKGDRDAMAVAIEWDNKKYVINSADELPDDPMGFSKAYTSVDFSNSTLLIAYNVYSWKVDTFSNSFYKNNVENTYNWVMTIGTSDAAPDTDCLTFSRFAILVRKLPANADVRIWWGLHSYDWEGWE